jgi:dienelactone hydrolase
MEIGKGPEIDAAHVAPDALSLAARCCHSVQSVGHDVIAPSLTTRRAPSTGECIRDAASINAHRAAILSQAWTTLADGWSDATQRVAYLASHPGVESSTDRA